VKLRWTKQALRDLSAIHDYIASDSPYYAAQVIDTQLAVESSICDQPQAGSMIQEQPRRDIRQVKRYSYRIIYRVKARQIDVLTVVHAKQNFMWESKMDE
jgi:toxin ParE1/3/4